MALVTSSEGDLMDFVRPSQQAASQFHDDPGDLCDNIFENLTKNVLKCDYFDVTCKNISTVDENSLILLHVNVRSLHKNFDHLYDFIASLYFTPHVICVSETRIKNNH